MEINFHGDKVVKSDVTIHREVFLFIFYYWKSEY